MDCLFIRDYYTFFSFLCQNAIKYNKIKLCYNRLQFVKEAQISAVLNIERRAKLHRSQDSSLIFARS